MYLRLIKHIFLLALFVIPQCFANEINGDYLVRKALQELLQKGDPDKVGDLLEKANSQYPNFKLANYLQAEYYSAMAGQLPGVNNARINSEASKNLFDEAKLRIASPANAYALRPMQIFKIPNNINYVILVDASISRAYIFKNQQGEPVLDNDFFITVGQLGVGKQKEGDQRTPLGLYRVGREVEKKHLTPLYGVGALTLDFPNSFDKYQKKSGSGIWLHGVPPNVYNRPPKASDGCIVFTNSDFKYILKISREKRVYVLVSSSVKWLTLKDWRFRYNKLINDLSDQILIKTANSSVMGFFAPESEQQIILERAIVNDSSQVYREFWERADQSWQLKFKSVNKLGG